MARAAARGEGGSLKETAEDIARRNRLSWGLHRLPVEVAAIVAEFAEALDVAMCALTARHARDFEREAEDERHADRVEGDRNPRERHDVARVPIRVARDGDVSFQPTRAIEELEARKSIEGDVGHERVHEEEEPQRTGQRELDERGVARRATPLPPVAHTVRQSQ